MAESFIERIRTLLLHLYLFGELNRNWFWHGLYVGPKNMYTTVVYIKTCIKLVDH